jgi:hypothetical protein
VNVHSLSLERQRLYVHVAGSAAGATADQPLARSYVQVNDAEGRSEIRVLFAFDPRRQAVLLVAGDKAGQWAAWYKRAIRLAGDRLDEHIERLRKER